MKSSRYIYIYIYILGFLLTNILRAQVKLHLMLNELIFLYIFQKVKSNCIQILRKTQITTMNLCLQIYRFLSKIKNKKLCLQTNKLLTHVLSFQKTCNTIHACIFIRTLLIPHHCVKQHSHTMDVAASDLST